MNLPIREIESDESRLSVHILKQYEVERELLKKEIPGRKWEAEKKYWTVPYTRDTLGKIDVIFKGKYQLQFTINLDIPDTYDGPFYLHNPNKKNPIKVFTTEPIKHPKAIDALEQDLILRRYSYATIKSYKLHLRQLLWFYNDKRPSQITLKEIKSFLYHKITKEKIAESTQNQAINAIKYFYKNVVGREKMFIDLKRPRKAKGLPGYLSPDEVSRLLKATNNIKHRAILMTIYASGLRLSEVVNLKISDIRSDQNHISIQEGKGKKDRTTLLSIKLLQTLRDYFRVYKPKYYLFEGQNGGQYSKRSVQAIMTQAVKQSGIRHATPHTLRHSFATHLVQQGVDITYIKELLGHGSIKTTEIYLHLSQKDLRKINSPLDNLDI